MKVNLPREFIKLSPISSAIIPHRTPDGHLSKTGYVKLLAFSQVIWVFLMCLFLQQTFYFYSSPIGCYLSLYFSNIVKKSTIANLWNLLQFRFSNYMTDCCFWYGKHNQWVGEPGCAVIHIGSSKQSSKFLSISLFVEYQLLHITVGYFLQVY